MPAANPTQRVAQAVAAPTPKPTPPMSQQWRCQLHGLASDGHSSTELPTPLTIGTKLLATCEGEPSPLTKTGLKIELNDQETHGLHLLSVLELTDTKATLIVTPWRAGDLKMKNPALVDAKTRVGMGDMDLTVATVIDPKTNPQGQPFGPVSPMNLAWPLWLWLFAAAVLVGIVYGLGLVVRQSLRRKKLLEALDKNATALSPVNHFNKELRRLQRKLPLRGQPWSPDDIRTFFSEFDSQFRWFLSRELVISALGMPIGAVMREFKKVDREVYNHSGRDVRIVLLELQQSLLAAHLDSDDAVQLMELSRRVADRIAKERNV